MSSYARSDNLKQSSGVLIFSIIFREGVLIFFLNHMIKLICLKQIVSSYFETQ